MVNVAFDNEQYLQTQSAHIRSRIAKFGGKLYLEFGGKLYDDNHASRVLPGFQPDSKLRMLLQQLYSSWRCRRFMMDERQKELFFTEFNNSLHRLGKILLFVSMILLLSVPFVIGALNSVMPGLGSFLSGMAKVGIIYIPVAIVEFLVYTPMLGVGGSYISFLTGNVTNMKIPCAMNARDMAGTTVGTPENEIISTISTATSAIVTTLVIVVGVLLIVPLQPVLQSETLLPAFNNVVPALFGALGLKYFAKSPKIAVIPLLLMSLLCIFVPAAISQTSLLMIPAGGLALAIGFVLFKKDKL